MSFKIYNSWASPKISCPVIFFCERNFQLYYSVVLLCIWVMWQCLNTTQVTVQALSIVTATARQLLVLASQFRFGQWYKKQYFKRMPNVGSGQYSPEVHWRKQKLWPEMHSCRKASPNVFRLPFNVGLWNMLCLQTGGPCWCHQFVFITKQNKKL